MHYIEGFKQLFNHDCCRHPPPPSTPPSSLTDKLEPTVVASFYFCHSSFYFFHYSISFCISFYFHASRIFTWNGMTMTICLHAHCTCTCTHTIHVYFSFARLFLTCDYFVLLFFCAFPVLEFGKQFYCYFWTVVLRRHISLTAIFGQSSVSYCKHQLKFNIFVSISICNCVLCIYLKICLEFSPDSTVDHISQFILICIDFITKPYDWSFLSKDPGIFIVFSLKYINLENLLKFFYKMHSNFQVYASIE